jgi:hypothetical protein
VLGILRRWAAWVTERGVSVPPTVLAPIGGAIAALLAWRVARDGAGLADAGSAGSIGQVIAGVVGLAAWVACWAIAGRVRIRITSTSEHLFGAFRVQNEAQIRSQWRTLLDGRDRLSSNFSGYRRIAPPRSFAGSLPYRSDLAAAVDAAAAPGGGPRLLVVGEPGYGKTVALLDVAEHLTDYQHDHDAFGMPVIFNLGSWRREDDDLTAWMVRVLCGATGPLPGVDKVVRGWLAAGRIAPMLDGLDEITDDDRRRRCVKAINAFIDRAPWRTAVVIASRPGEYTAITTEGASCLGVNAAIELERLRPGLVADRLRDVSPTGASRLADLVEADRTHPVVEEVLRVPLWLWLAGALDDARAGKLVAGTSTGEAQGILADVFLARAISDLDDEVHLGTGKCRRVLAAIAGLLGDPRSSDSVTFRFEDLTPARPPWKWVAAFGLVLGLLSGLLFGLIFGQPAGLALGLALGMTRLFADGRPTRVRMAWPGAKEMALWLLIALVAGKLVIGPALRLFGLSSGPFGGLVVGIIFLAGLINGEEEVVVPQTIDEGRTASRASLRFSIAVAGLFGALVTGLVGALDCSGGACGVAGVLVYGVAGGLIGALLGGLMGTNEGAWYLLLQRRIRRRASRQGLLPPEAVKFVAAAASVGILRHTGGGVQFRHRVISDRLANEAPIPGLIDLREPGFRRPRPAPRTAAPVWTGSPDRSVRCRPSPPG